MKAMIFAAGAGTRLKPLTDHQPKALVNVGNTSMLERVISNLSKAGATEIVVNTHHFADMIAAALQKLQRPGLTLIESREEPLVLETGGGIANARHLLSDNLPIIVHNADIITSVNLQSIYDAHLVSGADATLLTDSHRKSSRMLLTDSVGRMRGWTNVANGYVRPEGLDSKGLTPTAFGGIHIISQRLLDAISQWRPEGTPYSITDFYIAACNDFSIMTYQIPASDYWHDIGSPEKLAAAELQLRNEKA